MQQQHGGAEHGLAIHSGSFLINGMCNGVAAHPWSILQALCAEWPRDEAPHDGGSHERCSSDSLETWSQQSMSAGAPATREADCLATSSKEVASTEHLPNLRGQILRIIQCNDIQHVCSRFQPQVSVAEFMQHYLNCTASDCLAVSMEGASLPSAFSITDEYQFSVIRACNPVTGIDYFREARPASFPVAFAFDLRGVRKTPIGLNV